MGAEAVYATRGYGFLCLPRNITQRLAEVHYQFDEADAWLDLWCHTVWQEPGNAFSHMAPTGQLGKYGAVLALETLGHRWGWEKTKVWRFFKKHADAFPLQKLPGSFGCLIFNTGYVDGVPIQMNAYNIGGNNYVKLRDIGQMERSVPEPYYVSDTPTQTVTLNPGDGKEVRFENQKKPLLTLNKLTQTLRP